jgi:HK97 family phage major capsid protein
MTQRNRARKRAQGFTPEPTESLVAVPQAGVRSDAMAEGDSSVTISIMGDIGWDVTAEDVAAAVAEAKGKPLMVNVFSYGGDALQGLAIYSILSAHDAEVTTNVLGVAASAGSVIAMAGDKRIVPVNGAVMIHNPWTLTVGDAAEHRKSANMLDGLQAAYLHTYASATGLAAAEITPYLEEERWMYGEEALSLGFATETSKPVAAFASIKAPPTDRFKQMPDDIKAMAGITAEITTEVAPAIEEPSATETSEEPDAVLEPACDLKPASVDAAIASVTSLSTEHPAIGGQLAASLSMTAETDIREAAQRDERERVSAIRGLAKTHSLPGDFVDHLIDNGTSVADARGEVLERFANASRIDATVGAVSDAGHGSVGMSQAEVKAYSVMNVMRYLAEPSNASARDAAGYELEWSREVEKQHARSANGVLIPHDVLSQRPRAASVGVFSAGGALVAADRLDASFIDLIRQRSAFISSGVTVLTGLSGNVEIGRQTGKSTYYFVGEDVDVTASDLTFGLVNMSPKTIGARVPVSRRALIQTSPDMEMLVRNDIVNEITLGVDYVTGYGTGSSSQPRGLLNTSGIGSVTFSGGTTATYSTQQGGGTGSCGTFAQYVALETAIANANLDVANMRYVMNTATRGGLKTTLRDSVAGADYIFRDNGTVNGYQVTASNQLQQNDVFFGNWSDLIVGFWSGIDLIDDPNSQSAKGQVLFTAFQDFDVAARRADSFALGT